MFKKLCATFILSLFVSSQALAITLPFSEEEELLEDSEIEVEIAEEIPKIELNISANPSVEVNKKIIFDASASKIDPSLNFTSVTYEWVYGDGNREVGMEVVHTYAEPGEYDVLLIARGPNGEEASLVHKLLVYEQYMVLISSVAEKKEQIDAFAESAKEQNVLVNLIESYSSQSEFLAEEQLQNRVIENLNLIEQASTIVLWTDGSLGLTIFSQIKDTLKNEDFFENKNIILVSDSDFGSLKNIAKGTYQSINPRTIILTRPESIWALLESSTMDEYISLMEGREMQYVQISDGFELRPWNLLSSLVNSMIEQGVPSNTVRLILMLPVIVTIVAFMKQVFGLSTLGVYTPSILALSFIALDLIFGLIILLSILTIGTLTRIFLRRYRLLYIPRMALVLSIVSIAILFLLYFGALLDISSVVGIAVFPMLIMSTMVEKFISIQSGQGLKNALILVGEAILVAMLCYFVAEWNWLKVVILGHPEIILLFIFANVFMARWTGLRFMEYVRFREVIRHVEE